VTPDAVTSGGFPLPFPLRLAVLCVCVCLLVLGDDASLCHWGFVEACERSIFLDFTPWNFFSLFVLLWFPSTRWLFLGLMMIGGGIGVSDGVSVGLGRNEKGFSSLKFFFRFFPQFSVY
jgi:hypothetical protein